MKRVLALVFLLLLLLTGCAGTPPKSGERRHGGGQCSGGGAGRPGHSPFGGAEGRGEEEPFRCDSQGETPAAAVEGLTNRGEQVVSCAHVEHLLLTQNAAAPCRNCSVMPFRSPSRARKPSCGWSGRIPWRRPFPGRRTPPSG